MKTIILYVRNLSKPKLFLWTYVGSVTPDNCCALSTCRSILQDGTGNCLGRSSITVTSMLLLSSASLCNFSVDVAVCMTLKFWKLFFKVNVVKDKSGTMFYANWSHLNSLNNKIKWRSLRKEYCYYHCSIFSICMFPSFFFLLQAYSRSKSAIVYFDKMLVRRSLAYNTLTIEELKKTVMKVSRENLNAQREFKSEIV